MNHRPVLFSAAVLAAATLALTGCAGGDDAPVDEGALELVTPGTLTVCSEVPYPPFEMEDGNGGYTGFDLDLVAAIAEKLDLEVSIQDVGFDGLQSGTTLIAGTCDFGASAMTITEERKTNLDFADPYYDSLQSLLVKTDSGITGIDDLEGRNVAVQQGTTGENYAEENATGAVLVQYPGDAEMWPALQAGQVEAILQDLPVNIEHVKADSDYEVVEEYNTDEQYGFAFAKGERTNLREAVNGALQELRDSGEYDTIYDKYFSAE
ncbi:basic amino acid ABC transporter substrate-binding protein [Microbacterium esteraromaticum]|uniref:Basic amino acid ABC transporter substrate-binding protein n=1 Tax=Microbacterium esteraromaticum TaxID=57043 RepID=A0A939IUB7_9MICO|nr:basic amino acid ABC transporter substrate-binding protein [Microbacterium esteraromaticum]MBN8205251.1 basic amino acid ABC transporter substrate-binding protein [Microbacterium esteraromaticum]MBN8415405.1 basic amino acid ABC transporter substrate-binding protein [Microbacterium esteraromaticum]